MATFQDLTAELVDLLATHLDNAGLCALRLTSKECYERTYRQFAFRISNLGFLLAHHSLDALLSIAKHKRLSPAMKRVHLATRYLDSSITAFEEEIGVHGRLDHGTLLAGTMSEYEDPSDDWLQAQHDFLDGHATAMLAAIFSHLENLENIEIGEWSSDSWETRVRYYGEGTAWEETFRTYECNEPVTGGPFKATTGLVYTFGTILEAIAITKKQIKTLSAHCCEGPRDFQFICYVTEKAFSTLKSYLLSGLQTAFRTLETLSLSVSLFHYEFADDPEEGKMSVAKFINLAPQLRNLSLKFNHWTPNKRYLPTLNYRKVGELKAFINDIDISNLETLELQCVCLAKRDILVMLSKQRETLHNLTLNLVGLESDNWDDVLNALLEMKMPSLESVNLSWLFDWDTSDPNKFDDSVILFNEEGVDNCSDCCHLTNLFKSEKCSHISLSIQVRKGRDLPQLKRRPEKYFNEKDFWRALKEVL